MLEGRLVTLAPLDVDDITDDYVGWFNDPATFRFLGSKFGQTRSSVRRYVEKIQEPNLICRIIDKTGSRHVGNIALTGFDPIHRRAELGIVIGVAEARGKGFGKEACGLLVRYAFDHLNLHKITAGTVAGNDAMKKVFLDLGFTIEGTLAQHYFLEGRYCDYHRFALFRERFHSDR